MTCRVNAKRKPAGDGNAAFADRAGQGLGDRPSVTSRASASDDGELWVSQRCRIQTIGPQCERRVVDCRESVRISLGAIYDEIVAGLLQPGGPLRDQWIGSAFQASDLARAQSVPAKQPGVRCEQCFGTAGFSQCTNPARASAARRGDESEPGTGNQRARSTAGTEDTGGSGFGIRDRIEDAHFPGGFHDEGITHAIENTEYHRRTGQLVGQLHFL